MIRCFLVVTVSEAHVDRLIIHVNICELSVLYSCMLSVSVIMEIYR